jgi:GTP cyclohydrolase IA
MNGTNGSESLKVVKYKNGEENGEAKKKELNEKDIEIGLTESFSQILSLIGEDVNRPSIRKTPERAAKAFLYFTKGYSQTLKGNY